MNDLFYFSSELITLMDLNNLLSDSDSYVTFLTPKEDCLQISSKSGDIVWQIFKMDISSDFHDSPNINVIQEAGARVCFCISHHSWTLVQLSAVLKIFLKKYGGWIGNDTDDFAPQFTLANIDSLCYK